MTKLREIRHLLICTLLCGFVLGSVVGAGNRAQWQERFSRNGISDETGLADTFDPAAGKNIKWAAQLGSESWATPVIAGGRVYMGTNNDPPEGKPHDPRFEGDRGVLLCLDEKDGKFLWQLMVSKLGPDPYLDWPRAGMIVLFGMVNRTLPFECAAANPSEPVSVEATV